MPRSRNNRQLSLGLTGVITSPNVTSSTSIETLMTTEQLAEFLQVPLATLYQWRHKGTGPKGIKVGKHVRYRRSDVEAWLETQAAT